MTTADPNSVRKVLTVRAPQAVAWRVFTEGMSTWWPLAMYKIGAVPAVEAVIEPFVGGRWYERGDDGSTCDWGRVLSWEPNGRLVLTWDITADWQFDPTLNTEIEVRFVPEGADHTRVELEHRRLDRYGDRREEMRAIFDTGGDWGQVLQLFANTPAGIAMADIQSGRQTLVARILEGEGQAALPLRRAAFHAAQLDEPLKSLVSKVAEHAADIGDDDLARVRDSGLTEDQVFELVVCAAVGQATRQYERAIGALRAATAKE